MSESINQFLFKLYDKIKLIAKECQFSLENIKKESPYEILLYVIGNSLDQIKKYIINAKNNLIRLQNIDEQYKKLQNHLQKHENQIRKHISIQHHLKLYNDTIKEKFQDQQMKKQEITAQLRSNLDKLQKQNKTLLEENLQLKESINKSKSPIKKQSDFRFQKYAHQKNMHEIQEKSFRQISKSPNRISDIENHRLIEQKNNRQIYLRMKQNLENSIIQKHEKKFGNSIPMQIQNINKIFLNSEQKYL